MALNQIGANPTQKDTFCQEKVITMKGYLTVYLTQPQECPDDPGIVVPDVEILRDHASYCYHPIRGFSGSVVVENIDGHFIGWMSVDNLPGGPYRNVKEWINYVEN